MNLYRFNLSWGRMGDLDGLFIATEEEVASVMGQEVYFGEVLGKHSEVYDPMTEDHITRLVVSSTTVADMLHVCGNNISGYNPVAIWQEQQEYV